MSRNRNSDTLTIALTAAIVFWLDQWSKSIIARTFLPGESRMVIPNVLRWTYEQNNRGAFGLFGSNTALLIAMAMAVLVIFWFSFRETARHSLLVRIAFGMIVGGAVGNIVDRLHHRYVIDFIDFYRIWPNIFNVADFCITTGVILLILASFASRHRS
ncbi:MAG: signal peptidase II [Vulcanimicrobiaceae bacterium]